MTHSPLLGPVLALVGWTLVMLIWTITHLRKGLKTVDRAELRAGMRGRDLETKMEDRYSFPRQNYEHLVEQPTLFYAIMLSLVLMGETGTAPLALGWAYVAFRIVHSIAQVRGRSRSLGFGLSSLSLLALFVVALISFLS